MNNYIAFWININHKKMKTILPCLSKKTLDELNCGVYSYNVKGEPELFINTFSLNQLGGLNKVYKASIADIISRVIHPLDQKFGSMALQTISEHADQLYIHFRRFLIKNSQYKWMFVVNGANQITEEGNTKRIISFAKFLDFESDNIQECKEDLELIGFDICAKSLYVQLGHPLNGQLFNILTIEDNKTRAKELSLIEEELRGKLNFPPDWELEKIDDFLKVFPKSKITKQSNLLLQE